MPSASLPLYCVKSNVHWILSDVERCIVRELGSFCDTGTPNVTVSGSMPAVNMSPVLPDAAAPMSCFTVASSPALKCRTLLPSIFLSLAVVATLYSALSPLVHWPLQVWLSPETASGPRWAMRRSANESRPTPKPPTDA